MNLCCRLHIFEILSCNLLLAQGIACNLESRAFKYLHDATMEELGKSKPFSMCGSLPLVGDMQEAGFDIQVGFMRRVSTNYYNLPFQ